MTAYGRPTDVDHGGRRAIRPSAPTPRRQRIGPVAERLRECRAEDERDVFDRVVLVDLEVAGGPDLDVEQAVVRERREEVVVEPIPVEIRARPEPSRSSGTSISVSRCGG